MEKRFIIPLLVLIAALFAVSCGPEVFPEDPPVITFDNGTGVYETKAGRAVTITPTVKNATEPEYLWLDDSGKTLGSEPSYSFVSETAGTYYLTFAVTAKNGAAQEELRIDVLEKTPPSVVLPAQDGVIYAVAGKTLLIEPDVLHGGDEGTDYEWKLDGTIVSRDNTYSFTAAESGDYSLSLSVTNSDGTGSAAATVRVTDAPSMSVFFEPPTIGVPLGRTIVLAPFIYDEKTGAAYSWQVDGQKQEGKTGKTFSFTPAAKGNYTVEITAEESSMEISASVSIICTDPEGTHRRAATALSSQYSDAVHEFLPAPGQFVNEGYTAATMAAACNYAHGVLSANYASGAEAHISLGGFGGYIVVGFDHSIGNASGYDFAVKGNAYKGSSEPGIVWVMQDENGNGKPDDTWYELKGSESGKATTRRQYSVTYFKPETGHNVRWSDNLGNTGYIERTVLHKQESYYPAWASGEHYTLRGTCLGLRNSYNPGTGFWANSEYDWGYADNFGSDTSGMETKFDIANAVQADGTPVSLQYIDFVKVQTAVNGKSGPLGEISTEVLGFRDLNAGK